MLAFSNELFSEGVSTLLDGEGDIEVTGTLPAGSVHDARKVEGLDCDVLLTDFTTLYNALPRIESVEDGPSVILLDTDCGKENIVSAILKKRVCGVLLGNSDSELLKRAVRSVSNGEIWIDKGTVKELLNGINALEDDRSSVLTDREKEIVALTGEGYRNKEIAQKLNICEPTVKTHLHNIFQKLNIKKRSELITYALRTEGIGPDIFDRKTGRN